jgi:Cu+-exporting ATPase
MSQLIQLSISGMNCQHCVDKIERALKAVPGVVNVEVDLPARSADVQLSASQSGAEDLVAAVVSAGYGAQVQSFTSD